MPARAPLQLFAGLHYLVLSGRASWDDPRGALAGEGGFLREWMAAQPVQTNEVGRCWWLLPCFLEVARRTGAEAFDCVELGCSAGLNLLWDSYGYRYERGAWTSTSDTVLLRGEERAPVPREVLEARPVVRSRIGVDRHPPDLHDEDAVRRLKAFVWAGDERRLARLDAAVSCWREQPPEVRTGDMVDELPSLLGRRREGALLLVWQTAALTYLPGERRERVRDLLAAAGADGPLAFVETRQPLDGSHDYYGLFMQLWPEGERVELARSDFHGAWLEWREA